MAEIPSSNEDPRSHEKRATEPNAPAISIQAFLSNFFFGVFIQDQEDVFEITYDRRYARDLVEE